jgi:hypothetical protein
MCAVLPSELQAALDALPSLRAKVHEALALFALEAHSVEARTEVSLLLQGLDAQLDHSIAKAHQAVRLWTLNALEAEEAAEALRAPERLVGQVVGTAWDVLHGAPVLPR